MVGFAKQTEMNQIIILIVKLVKTSCFYTFLLIVGVNVICEQRVFQTESQSITISSYKTFTTVYTLLLLRAIEIFAINERLFFW